MKLETAYDVGPTEAPFQVVMSVRETYRGYEIEVGANGKSQDISVRPLKPDLPIFEQARVQISCSQEQALSVARVAVDRLLRR